MTRERFSVERHRVALGILLGLLVLAVYLPALDGGFLWDDDAYVSENQNLRDLQGLKRIWLEPRSSPQYYPMVFTGFWIERQLFGAGPLPGHLVNVALHVLNALLLWAVLRRLGVAAAFVAALVFAVHPVALESVAWITERKNVLSTGFYLAALAAYLAFALPPGSGAPRPPARSRRLWLLSLLLFVGALLSKTVTVTLPAVLLILLWWKREKLAWRDVVPLVPFFALAVPFGLLTIWLETHHVGATGEAWELSPLGRVLLAGRVVWFYAG
ncbi:MAG TPA: O-GlcNAc transferase, partial [Thermoanaerobaculia bacterium]|nr:O-GlcNAc transferase [Thermoanaerobaculia bacterium]